MFTFEPCPSSQYWKQVCEVIRDIINFKYLLNLKVTRRVASTRQGREVATELVQFIKITY